MSEKTLVEDYLIGLLTAAGWTDTPAAELPRESYEEPLLAGVLARQLATLNADLEITDTEIQQTLNELRGLGVGMEGNRRTLEFLKQGVPIKFDKDRTVKHVRLFDYSQPDRNEFCLSRQVTFQAGERVIRADLVLFVNGIPLVVIECKNPAAVAASWQQAYRDIKGYEQKVPELFKYAQLGIAAERDARYFPIVPWQDEVKTETWRDGEKPPLEAIAALLAPAMLLGLVRHYLAYRAARQGNTKVVARYMQYQAAEKIAARAGAYAKDPAARNRGLIWHWQGSGKTLTMLFAALKLKATLGNPTILFVVDRDELESQLKDELEALGMSPFVIESVAALREAIAHDGYRGRRGLILSLVHKFRPEEMAELIAELERREVGEETLRSRRDVVALIDEGHRTQYGTLAATMKKLLPAAACFAFTGTPIAKRGRDTWQEFGYPPDELYLDQYFIADSLRDRFTVKIARQPRLQKSVHLDKALLDAFLAAEFEEVPDELRDEVKASVRKRLTTIKTWLKNPDRIEQVAADIALHFKERVDGRFKAMVVAVDREACVTYKRELDKLLPGVASEIVMSYTPKDAPAIAAHGAEVRKRYPGRSPEEIKKAIVERFLEEAEPRILVVTDMLLTGFDAPILQTLYLDKPLKEHRLLQAMARTNRPYGDLKEQGVVVDYIGVLGEFNRALGMYGKEELQRLALVEPAAAADEFRAELASLQKLFRGLPKRDYARENIVRAVEILTTDAATGNEFSERYRKLRRLFELLGSDPLKAELISDYRWLSAVHVYYRKEALAADDETEEYVHRHFPHTLEHIYQTTEIEALNRDLPQLVFDEKYLAQLAAKAASVTERAANIVFTLNRFVLVDQERGGIFITIADKVEEILNRWREKNKDYERIYKDGVKVVKEVETLRARQRELGFSDFEYSLLLILERQLKRTPELAADARELAAALKPEMFAGWALQPTARKKIERELRSRLRKAIPKYGITYEAMDALYHELREYVVRYGDRPDRS